MPGVSLATGVSCGILPGVVLGVEGTIGLPDGEDQVEQLAHAVADGDVAALAFGLEAAVEGADGRVMADGRPRGIPEVAAHQIVALARHVHRARGQGVALLVDPRAVLLGKDAEVADELIGRLRSGRCRTILATRTAAVASPMPGMVTTWTWGEAGRSAKAVVNNFRRVFSAFWQ